MTTENMIGIGLGLALAATIWLVNFVVEMLDLVDKCDDRGDPPVMA